MSFGSNFVWRGNDNANRPSIIITRRQASSKRSHADLRMSTLPGVLQCLALRCPAWREDAYPRRRNVA